jgi:hypothetical protein
MGGWLPTEGPRVATPPPEDLSVDRQGPLGVVRPPPGPSG